MRKAVAIGVLAGLGCFTALTVFHLGTGDFVVLTMARDVLAGRNPYAHPTGPYWVPYPMPAVLLGIPFTWLPDSAGAAAWFGLSSALLVWGMLRVGEAWRMGMLFSFPFLYAMIFAQWSPLLAAVWFVPELASVILCKPHIAAPVVLTSRITEPAIWTTAFWLVTSFVVRPSWLFEWIAQVGQYQGLKPPILMALGPLVLVLLACIRDRHAQLVLLMACMPQRVFYDQLVLLLVAKNPAELFVLVGCGWASFMALWCSPGMYAMPAGGWSTWLIMAHYLPAVGMVLFHNKEELKCLRPLRFLRQ